MKTLASTFTGHVTLARNPTSLPLLRLEPWAFSVLRSNHHPRPFPGTHGDASPSTPTGGRVRPESGQVYEVLPIPGSGLVMEEVA